MIPCNSLDWLDENSIKSEFQPLFTLEAGDEGQVLLNDVLGPAGVDAIPTILHTKLVLLTFKQISHFRRITTGTFQFWKENVLMIVLQVFNVSQELPHSSVTHCFLLIWVADSVIILCDQL